MGGTTTDLSIVFAGTPVQDNHGIKLGNWQTSVHGVLAFPYALGGDSAVRAIDCQLSLASRRVTPLCVAASRWPKIKTGLHKLLFSGRVSTFPLHEFFYLVHEPAAQKRFSLAEQALIEALRKGPCMLEDLKHAAGIDLYSFKSERLEAEGVIMRAGLTPTDFMHLKGDYCDYDSEAAELAARYLLCALRREDTTQEVQQLASEVYDLVKRQLYENLLKLILGQKFPERFGDGISAQMELLIRHSWERRVKNPAEVSAKTQVTSQGWRDGEQRDGEWRAKEPQAARQHTSPDARDSIFDFNFSTNMTLVGIGAPTHIFLPDVAAALNTKYIMPEHASVANALGALMANIAAVARVQVAPSILSSGDTHYIAHAPNGSMRYEREGDALAHAKKAAETEALKLAQYRGARGKLTVQTHIEKQTVASVEGGEVNLGKTVVATVEVDLVGCQ